MTERWPTLRRWLSLPTTRIGLVLLTIVLAISIIGPLVWDLDPLTTDAVNGYASPSGDHPLGTDRLGRDVLARLLAAGTMSIIAGVAAVGIGAIVGIVIGIASGFIGGRFDAVVMRVVDVLLAFPMLLNALVVIAIIGPSMTGAVIAVSVSAIAPYARVLRGTVLPIRTATFVKAARVSNTPLHRMLRVHVLPNVRDVALVLLVIGAGNGIVVLSALSFLGIGTQPPDADWGVLLTEGVRAVYFVPAAAVAPAVMLLITVLGINLIGEGLGTTLRTDRRPHA
ncbi:ABC transporter permease [Desertimonas flava]|uniref:ABC transporter permease n=1 Tax=Desertimonas flava TaxID=2064846 RepID=UPI000E34EB32|nr:ABC transporter permease [Desertimonas flava]